MEHIQRNVGGVSGEDSENSVRQISFLILLNLTLP
jgi:hypothetical protein